jgi:PAS domain S-box-containing protein/putative nucleotidyltransferase with HDIG domain
MSTAVAVYEAIDDGKDFIFKDFNKAGERIEKVNREALIGKSVLETFPGVKEFGLFEVFQEVWKTGKAQQHPISLYKDERIVGWRENYVYKLPSGEVVSVYDDVTARKEAEDALRDSERQLRLVTDQVTDVIWSMDFQGNFTFITPSAERMLGYTVGEMLSLNLSHIITPESYTMAMDRISKGMELEKREPIILEMQQVCKDGSKKWCEITAIFSTDYDNRPSGIIGVTRDISERKRSEEKLQRSYDKLRDTMIATVNTLASTVEMRDPYTAGHQRRVTILACAMAEEMGLTEEQFDGLRMAGLVHDIGKFSVPVEILNKPGRISEIEFNIIKVHPQAGYNILKKIEFPWPVAQIVLQHHERLDGSGYPQGLKNGGIMLEAKILAVADVVEAMASHRPYRPALSIEVALEEIAKNRGILYDPDVADVCSRLFINKGFVLGQEM